MDATLTLSELSRVIYQNVSKSQTQWSAASPVLVQIMRGIVMHSVMPLLLLKKKPHYCPLMKKMQMFYYFFEEFNMNLSAMSQSLLLTPKNF